MIIVSQGKETIVNFNKTDCLWVDYDEGKYTIEASSDINYELGKYETEERAKEVLQEIVKKYSAYLSITGGPALIQGGMDIQPNVFNIPKVYEMPEN